MNTAKDIIAAQSPAIQPETFQWQLVERISEQLLSEQLSPCLLRAPTGAGKTYVISMVLEQVTNQSPTIWFWFVPFSILVQQTEDSIAANTCTLTPASLMTGLNLEPSSGIVIISTAASVSKAASRKKGYSDGEDDDVRSLADQVARARARNLKIGLVVDEAHIGLDSQTEFGKFAEWLKADRLIMATATPRDQRITDFLASAGYLGFQAFSVSRDEVVAARLNKRYIETVIYDLRSSMQSITDLQRTVLRQAWKRNKKIEAGLAVFNIPLIPLLLVQVGNGGGTVEAAVKSLINDCGVPIQEIGMHTTDLPNPVLMASIANDPTKRVLVFKQSAGTGFDAPRAFVLASTKSVNDPDFATQFIGRVMRVTRQIRSAFPKPTPIPDDLDTAYIYLANMEAQAGFEQAVTSTAQVKSQLEGQSEKLIVRTTETGAVVYTNRRTNQPTLPYGPTVPEVTKVPQKPMSSTTTETGATQLNNNSSTGRNEVTFADDLFGTPSWLDQIAPDPAFESLPKGPPKLTDQETLIEDLAERGISVFRRRTDLNNLPLCLKRELRPEMSHMSEISRQCATRLNISVDLIDSAVKTALDRQKETERHIELTTKQKSSVDVAVITDRISLARESKEALAKLPQVEDEDRKIILLTLTKRMLPHIQAQFDHLDDGDEGRPDTTAMNQYARDAAHVVIRKLASDLEILLHQEIAARAKTLDAGPLPDAMLFPTALFLESSFRNIYGVLPPSDDDLEMVAGALIADDRDWCKEETYQLDDGKKALLANFDSLSKLNGEERAFAKALDLAGFVHWWHRNPDRKSWSVALVRGEHKNHFYPDFVICLEHFPGDDALMRLVDTKENTKDAAKKLKHTPSYYGKVMFLTKDGDKIRIIKDDGALGEVVDFDDLKMMRERLRETAPPKQI